MLACQQLCWQVLPVAILYREGAIEPGCQPEVCQLVAQRHGARLQDVGWLDIEVCQALAVHACQHLCYLRTGSLTACASTLRALSTDWQSVIVNFTWLQQFVVQNIGPKSRSLTGCLRSCFTTWEPG